MVPDLPPEQQLALRRADGAGFRAPMLATLSKEHAPGRGWVFENKLDGEIVAADGTFSSLQARMHAAVLEMLRARLDPLAAEESPFADRVRHPGRHGVRPELVCAVGFSEWTTDGRLRHPRYQGLREDKDPAEVVREQ